MGYMRGELLGELAHMAEKFHDRPFAHWRPWDGGSVAKCKSKGLRPKKLVM
jgi:hypothetical protein